MWGLATKSKISVTHMRPDHLDTVLETLHAMGARFDITKDSVTITNTGLLQATKIETRIYPGIPTDLQPLFGVLATQTQGTTLINKTLLLALFDITRWTEHSETNIAYIEFLNLTQENFLDSEENFPIKIVIDNNK